MAGHRRLAAVDIASSSRPELATEIPVVIADAATADHAVDAIIENVQRVDLNPVEEARAYKGRLDAGWTVKGLAQDLGVTQARVKDRLSLLKLPEDVLGLIADGKLPLALVKPLNVIADKAPAAASLAAKRAVNNPAEAKRLASATGEVIKELCSDPTSGLIQLGGRWDVERLNALGDAAKDLADTMYADQQQPYGLDFFTLYQEDADAVFATGAALKVGDRPEGGGVICVGTDVEVVVTQLTARYVVEITAAEKEHKKKVAAAKKEAAKQAEAAVNAGIDPLEAARLERDRKAAEEKAAAEKAAAEEKQHAKEARGANLDLYRDVAAAVSGTGFQLRPLVELVVRQSLADMDLGHNFQAGLRLCVELFQEESEKTKSRFGGIGYAGNTKREARELAAKWILAGQTGEELLQRYAIFMAAAVFADQRAQKESSRVGGKVAEGTLELLAEYLGDAVPERLRTRRAEIEAAMKTSRGYVPQALVITKIADGARDWGDDDPAGAGAVEETEVPEAA